MLTEITSKSIQITIKYKSYKFLILICDQKHAELHTELIYLTISGTMVFTHIARSAA